MLSGTERDCTRKAKFFGRFTQPSSEAKNEKATRRSETTFRCRPFFVSSAGKSDAVGPSGRLHFLLVRFLYARKENEHKDDLFLNLECFGVDFVLMDLVVDDPEAGVEFPGCPGLVAPCSFQGLDDELPLEILHSPGKGEGLF